MLHRVVVVVTGAAVIALACWAVPERAAAQEPEAAGVECGRAPTRTSAVNVIEGEVYARPRGVPLRLDVARPAGDTVLPAVLLVHGGGWASGSRAQTRSTMRAFARRGYVAASVDYRLARSRRTTFPAAVSDVRCAVRHLRAAAGRHHLDPERIVAVGFSAGGHLAAMLAVASDQASLDDGTCPVEGVEPRVRGAVAWAAPLDLRGRVGRPRSARIVHAFLGARPADAPDRAALASPIVHVGAGDAPMLLVHGTADRVVSIEQSRAMYTRLIAAGVSADLVEVSGAGHSFGFAGRNSVHRMATCTTLATIERWVGP